MKTMMTSVLLAVLASLVVTGCSGDDGGADGGVDAAVVADGGGNPDAQVNPDAMVNPDASDDGGQPPPDSGVDGGADGGPSGTFPAFVIDLIENRTAENNAPVAVPNAQTAPDDNRPGVFDSLF